MRSNGPTGSLFHQIILERFGSPHVDNSPSAKPVTARLRAVASLRIILKRRLPMELILIIVVVLLLFGGGGYWGRGRGYW
jgi:hypothetical protein